MAVLGRTKIDAYPLGLGGIPLYYLDRAEARAVIEACLRSGVNFADTAEGYSDSEEKLSIALEKDRGSFYMASKSMKRSASGMIKAIDQSLARLRTDYIDIYQIHALASVQELNEIMAPGGALEALKSAREQGKVRFIGVTGHHPAVLVEAIKTGEFDTVMAPVNVVDREAEEVLLPLAKELDVGILSMKPVCGGTLDNPRLGLRYSLNTSADVVLVGMKSVAEVEENIATVRSFKPLTQEEQDEILAATSQMGNKFCRRCRYCQPCPQGINIPRILWLANVHRRGVAGDDVWTEQEYALLEEKADYCEECGQCEDLCPYELSTMDMLKEAHIELSPSSKTLAKRNLRKALNKAKGIIKPS